VIAVERCEVAVAVAMELQVVGLEQVEVEHAKIAEMHRKDRHLPQRLQRFG
jgi:hypothetical protein